MRKRVKMKKMVVGFSSFLPHFKVSKEMSKVDVEELPTLGNHYVV